MKHLAIMAAVVLLTSPLHAQSAPEYVTPLGHEGEPEYKPLGHEGKPEYKVVPKHEFLSDQENAPAHDDTPEQEDTPEHELPPKHEDTLARQGKHAAYVELFGSGMNVLSLNYERMLTRDLHIRTGGSYFGFSTKLRYEGHSHDLFVDLYSLPVSVSRTFYEGVQQLELGLGFTLLSYSFTGGPFDLGYHEVRLDNRYRGLALTGTIGYRVSIREFLFRIGISPHYMLTLDNRVAGFFEEMEDRGVLDSRELFDLRGFRMIPGLSFGRTF